MSDEPKPLLVVDYGKREVTTTDLVKELEAAALEAAALVGKVSNAAENELAVEAQKKLAGYIKLVGKAESAIKDPLNDLRSKVIQLSKDLIKDADAEGRRIAGLVGDFQEKERVKLVAEQNSVNAELSELARKEALELSSAQTIEEQDAVRERYSQQALVVATSASASVRASGQRVTVEWDITVQDVWKLARAHPNCVTVTPRLNEIKTLLNMGVTVQGVSAKKAVKATVVSKKETKAIETT